MKARTCSLSLWERVGVRARGLATLLAYSTAVTFTPALPQRMSEEDTE